MKLNKCLLLLLFANCCFSQQITTGKIKPVTQNGLHKIFLPAQLRSASKPDLGDLRIYNSKNEEVPYAVINPDNNAISHQLTEFPILSNKVVPNKSTTIIVQNPKEKLNEITLRASNAELTKKFSISGSNDQKNWFGLINSRELSEIKNQRTTSAFKTIPFPMTSYKYLKFVLNDSLSLPLNISAIGYIENEKQSSRIENVIPDRVEIKNISSEKKTTIHIAFEKPQLFEEITFDVKSPALFKRQVRVYKNEIVKIKHKTQIEQRVIHRFELIPESKTIYLGNAISEKDFFIEIDNRDNPPLQFSSINFKQKLIAVAVDLKAKEEYTINSGNTHLRTPDYDLSYFTNDLNSKLPETEITQITTLHTKKNNTETNSFWQQKWFMWICIGLGGIAILFFSIRLAKDVK